MATDMVNGYIYILESDAVDNVNWVPTVDNVILAGNYTEGTDFVKLEIPKKYKIKFKTGCKVTDSGAGSSFDLRSARRSYAMLANGIETSRANAEKIMNFLMLDRHTSGAAATFKRYYMIIKYDTTSYVQFIDASSTLRDYCKGDVIDGDLDWDGDDPLVVKIKLNWRSVW